MADVRLEELTLVRHALVATLSGVAALHSSWAARLHLAGNGHTCNASRASMTCSRVLVTSAAEMFPRLHGRSSRSWLSSTPSVVACLRHTAESRSTFSSEPGIPSYRLRASAIEDTPAAGPCDIDWHVIDSALTGNANKGTASLRGWEHTAHDKAWSRPAWRA